VNDAKCMSHCSRLSKVLSLFRVCRKEQNARLDVVVYLMKLSQLHSVKAGRA